MKRNIKLLILCLLTPTATGGVSALLTRKAMSDFKALAQPPLSPPAWLFPVVWTVLYLLMGYSLYLVITSKKGNTIVGQSVTLFGIQLFFNFFWSIFFFKLGLYYFSFLWLVVMWGLILAMTLSFAKASRIAAYMNLPYLAWVAFAGYLNLGIAILN